jgi:hypothetical protein
MKRIAFILLTAWATAALHAASVAPFPVPAETIVDPTRGAAYVAKPNGTIDAVGLDSGQTIWTSSDTALPLGVDGHFLVAQSESDSQPATLPIAVVHTTSGRKLVAVAIPLPSGVHVSVGQAPNVVSRRRRPRGDAFSRLVDLSGEARQGRRGRGRGGEQRALLRRLRAYLSGNRQSGHRGRRTSQRCAGAMESIQSAAGSSVAIRRRLGAGRWWAGRTVHSEADRYRQRPSTPGRRAFEPWRRCFLFGRPGLRAG